MKYIDAEKLFAEIERLKEETCIGICEYDSGEEHGRFEVLNHLLSTITSLQQEQQEEELNEETITNEFRIIGDKCFNEGIEGWQREKLIARHFYELGLNARSK